jgi:hypothetical protein
MNPKSLEQSPLEQAMGNTFTPSSFATNLHEKPAIFCTMQFAVLAVQ